MIIFGKNSRAIIEDMARFKDQLKAKDNQYVELHESCQNLDYSCRITSNKFKDVFDRLTRIGKEITDLRNQDMTYLIRDLKYFFTAINHSDNFDAFKADVTRYGLDLGIIEPPKQETDKMNMTTAARIDRLEKSIKDLKEELEQLFTAFYAAKEPVNVTDSDNAQE